MAAIKWLHLGRIELSATGEGGKGWEPWRKVTGGGRRKSRRQESSGDGKRETTLIKC